MKKVVLQAQHHNMLQKKELEFQENMEMLEQYNDT